MIAQREKAVIAVDKRLQRDCKTLLRFIEFYCHARHPRGGVVVLQLKGFDIPAIAGRQVALCPDCTKLAAHALVKRSHCPMAPKPECKHCPDHCYHPDYRKQIREVMRFSGTQMMLRGRVDYLLHLLT
jgi:hypothetical protein